MNTHFFAASLNQDIPTIDLHGIGNITSALEQLERQLFSFYTDKQKHCRVIYGIGEGILAKNVQTALNKNPMVLDWKHEDTGGSCIVLL